MPIREITKITEHVSTNPVDPGEDLQTWLADVMIACRTRYLLAHADDGVIWGRMVDGALVTARDRAQTHEDDRQKRRLLNVSPPLRLSTLWEARLFDEHAMYHLWRNDQGWQGTFYWGKASEHTVNFTADERFNVRGVVDEAQLTWGERDARYNFEDFTVMRDGKQGLVHAVPYAVDNNTRVLLRVRHYVQEEKSTGFQQIVATRLVGFDTQPDK
jgi:CRISPR-associated protein (TIGR03984 family)